MVHQHCAGLGNLCVIDKTIQLAKTVNRLLYHVLYCRLIAAIRDYKQRLDAVICFQILSCLDQCTRRTSRNNDIGALFCKCLCNTIANPSRTAGNQYDFTFHLLHGCRLLINNKNDLD